MKRLLCLCAITAVLFCSCAKAPVQIAVNKSFSTTAEIEYNSTAFTVTFTCSESGCSAVFLSPENIRGLKADFNGTQLTYSYDGISFATGVKKEFAHFLELIFFALSGTPVQITENESGYTLEGTVQGLAYYLNINKEQLNPAYLEIDEKNLTVRFL